MIALYYMTDENAKMSLAEMSAYNIFIYKPSGQVYGPGVRCTGP